MLSFNDPLPRIRCAVCDKPIIEMRMESFDFGKQLRITVYCHGAVEHRDFQSTAEVHKAMKESWGMAFDSKALTNG